MTPPVSSDHLASKAWEKIKPFLLQANEHTTSEWGNRYIPGINEVESYFHGSRERFSMLLDIIRRHLPRGRVLDAGAGHGIQAIVFKLAGYQTFASDIYPSANLYEKLGVEYRQWNLETQPAPFPKHFFDTIVLSQTIEHFTYSPLHPIREMLHVLKPEGFLLIDAPNISSFNNIWRLMRGKTIHWNLKKHYLEQQPNIVNGIPYFDRHNHEYSMQDFDDIASFFHLEIVEHGYYSPLNKQKPLPTRWASKLRDCIPHWRKGLYCLFRKPSDTAIR